MNKLNIFILIALCFSACHARSCLNFYQGVDETTGKTVVEGLISNYLDSDNGEYYQGGTYQSYVTEKGNGLYEVQGSYQTYVNAYVNHVHLCYIIYQDKQSTTQVPYQFSRQRDPSRIGQQYTQGEVTPDLNQVRKDLLQEIVQTAINNQESEYIIDTLESLVDVQAIKQY